MTTLDELRRANLREQRRSADERLAPKEPAGAPAVTAAPSTTTPVLNPAQAAPPLSPAKAAPAPEKTALPPAAETLEIIVAPTAELVPSPAAEIVPAAANASNGAHAAANPSHAVPGAVPPADIAAVAQTENLIDRVHLALARKVIHPTGVKATVDMPPDLFWRLKRYCRDHNNVTVRQVFLDLMIGYLDEEGY